MPFVLVTAPSVEPLTPADIRTRLNVPVTVPDGLLAPLISAARLTLERQYGIAFINQTIEYVADRFPGYDGFNQFETGFHSPSYGVNFNSPFSNNYWARDFTDFVIPYMPIQTITSIAYLDPSGVSQTLDSSQYVLQKEGLRSRVQLAFGDGWPSSQYVTDAIRIRFQAGFGADATAVPENLKMAMVLHIAHLKSLTSQNLFVSLDSVTGVGEKRYVVGGEASKVIDAAVANLMRDYVRVSM